MAFHMQKFKPPLPIYNAYTALLQALDRYGSLLLLHTCVTPDALQAPCPAYCHVEGRLPCNLHRDGSVTYGGLCTNLSPSLITGKSV